MDIPADRVELQPGMEVVSRDGDKLGKVVALDNTQITVEKGFLFPTDYVIPLSAVNNADDQTIYLNLSKDDALNQRWTQGGEAPRGMSASATAGAAGATDAAARSTSGDALTIPVHEEELTATKHAVDAGQVQITKQVVREDRTLEVPVREERVHVTRRAVDRDATGAETAFEGGTINVPLQTEQVDLQKRVRVAEEVDVAKDAVQKTQQVSGTVRREVVDVQDATGAGGTEKTRGATSGGSTRR